MNELLTKILVLSIVAAVTPYAFKYLFGRVRKLTFLLIIAYLGVALLFSFVPAVPVNGQEASLVTLISMGSFYFLLMTGMYALALLLMIAGLKGVKSGYFILSFIAFFVGGLSAWAGLLHPPMPDSYDMSLIRWLFVIIYPFLPMLVLLCYLNLLNEIGSKSKKYKKDLRDLLKLR